MNRLSTIYPILILLGGSLLAQAEGDCNGNGIADRIEIAEGAAPDCNRDGIPDTCLSCPPVEVVFLIDASLSMADEAAAICKYIPQIVADLAEIGLKADCRVLGITKYAARNFDCFDGNVADLLGSNLPDPPGCCPVLESNEDWAGATSIVAEHYPWKPGVLRLIIPFGDEGSLSGDPCEDPGRDRNVVEHAIDIAARNRVFVSPVAGTGSNACVISLGADLAAGSGGTSFVTTDPNVDLPDAIFDSIRSICQSITDCNRDNIPDDCEGRTLTLQCGGDLRLFAEDGCCVEATLTPEAGNLCGRRTGISVTNDFASPTVGRTGALTACFPIGTTVVTFTATDSLGRSISCSTTVEVVDNTNPVIAYCPEIQ